MNSVQLGNTGIEVTELGHGTLIFGKLQAQLSSAAGAAALKRSYELGVRFIDTAQLYDSYRHIRAFLNEVRPDDVVIASKSQAKTYDDMMAAVDEARSELGVETVDIMHLHGVADHDDFMSRRAALDALVECKHRSTIRAIGVSSHSVAGIRATAHVSDITVVHPIFNRKSLGLTAGTTEELLEELRRLKKRDVGIYAMKVFAGGHYVNEMEQAIAYVRETGIVDAAVVGMKTPEEVEMDVRLFETGSISDTDRQRLARFDKKLIVYDICERCGNCVSACQQHAMVLDENKARNTPDKCVLCGYCAEVCPRFAIRVI